MESGLKTSHHNPLCCADGQVTVGEEGYFKQGSDVQDSDTFRTPSDAKPNWTRNIGRDYVSQHASPNIDFASFHLCVT
jgi:hypothetical protein